MPNASSRVKTISTWARESHLGSVSRTTLSPSETGRRRIADNASAITLPTSFMARSCMRDRSWGAPVDDHIPFLPPREIPLRRPIDGYVAVALRQCRSAGISRQPGQRGLVARAANEMEAHPPQAEPLQHLIQDLSDDHILYQAPERPAADAQLVHDQFTVHPAREQGGNDSAVAQPVPHRCRCHQAIGIVEVAPHVHFAEATQG